MTITVVCPNCDKKYFLKEKLIGKKAKCTCGCIFRVGKPRQTVEERTTKPLFDAFETQPKEESNVEKNLGANILAGLSEEEDDTSSFFQSRQKSPAEPIEHGLVTEPRHIANERSMAKEIFIRLAYGFPCLIIVAIFAYYKMGLFSALLITVFTATGFCVVMYKIISVHKERAAEGGMTFKQYQREWAGYKDKQERKVTSPKLKFSQGVFYCSLILLLGHFIIPDEWATKMRLDLSLTEHWKMGLLILVLNSPVLLFLATWLMGGWRKYVSITGRLFLWERLPFHYFFKGYWRIFEKMSREELFGWAATDMLYTWICLLEYLFIKAMFFN